MTDAAFDRMIEKVRARKKELAEEYNTDSSSIVWMGDNKYIVVTRDGKEIRV